MYEKSNIENFENKLLSAINIINSILHQNSYNSTINSNDVTLFKDIISDIDPSNEKKISNYFFENYIPIQEKSVLFHFTKFDNALKMIENEEIYLSPLSKYSNQREYIDFYKNHNLNLEPVMEIYGYDFGIKKYMCNTYFFSFTREITEDNYFSLWNNHAEGKSGVMFEFENLEENYDLRKILYLQSNQVIDTFKKISTELEKSLELKFGFYNISKFGTYVLTCLNNERESRLSIYLGDTRYQDDKNKSYYLSNKNNYIGESLILPFQSSFCKLKLNRVVLGKLMAESEKAQICILLEKKNIKYTIDS